MKRTTLLVAMALMFVESMTGLSPQATVSAEKTGLMGGQFGSEELEQNWIQAVPKDNEDDDDAHEDDLPNASDPLKEAIYYINNVPIAP